MKTMFRYNKFANEDFNTLVESFGSLCDAYVEGKSNTAEYKEANRAFSETFMKECAKADSTMEFSDMEQLKDPMIHNNLFFVQRFNTLLSQMISPVVPSVISGGYNQLYDVTQVGFGDSCKYVVESNEMFIGATCSYITL